MLNIGIIGYGFVGKSMEKVFEYNAIFHIVDPKYSELSINDLVEKTSLIFVCLPAPTNDSNIVDYSLISGVFSELDALKYHGLVVVKSTLPPNAVEDLTSFGLRYIYSPEFLREKSWEEDAVNPDLIILAGDFFDCEELEELYHKHSQIVDKSKPVFKKLDYKEASLVKYAINTFLASKVIFMNQMYQLYIDTYGKEPHWESWTYFIETIAMDQRIGKSHMVVPGPDHKFGYGGTCFPKDVRGIIGYDAQGRLSLLREVNEVNTKLRLS